MVEKKGAGHRLKDRIGAGKYGFNSHGRNARLATRLCNPEPVDYLNPPNEADPVPKPPPIKKAEYIDAEELLQTIGGLLKTSENFSEKTYSERKRLLIDYLHVASETFPIKCTNKKDANNSLLQVYGL